MTILKCPEIRFKNEDGNNYPDWEEKKLDNVFKFYKGKGISKIELSEEGTPCIIYGELYTKYREVIGVVKSKTNIKKELLFMSEIGDILIPSSGETQKDIATASTVMEKNVALGGDINILRSKETINSPYVSYYLKHIKNIEISKLSQGNSVVHLYSKQLSNLKIEIPSLEEQQKIGDFFMLLDKRIEQQEEKIALLKDYKKTMMQKIFSQKIRFKDENGNDYPDWEEKKLGEISNIQTGNMNVEDNIPDGKYYFFDRSVTIKKLNSFTFDNEAIIYPGEGSEFLPRYFNGKYALHQRSYSVNSVKDNSIKYIYHFLKTKNNHFLTTAVGSTVKSLRKNCFENCIISLPCLLEQEKIALFLTSIDKNIDENESILYKFKDQKQALLSKIFV